MVQSRGDQSVWGVITVRRQSARTRFCILLSLLAAVGFLLWPSRQLRSDTFLIYQPASRTAIPVQIVDQSKYLPILPVLNAVGKVGAIQEKRATLKVWFDTTELELRLDEKRVRLGKTSLTLGLPVRRPGSQWLVPVEFLTAALPSLTGRVVEYKVGANRIFVGDVKPLTFSLRLDLAGNGVRLTVQFSDKVALRTASSNGKWFLYLGDRPVQPLETSFHFQNPYITEVQFDDEDGVPKLVVTPGGPGLNFYPVLAEGGKVLFADVLKPPATQPPMPAAGIQAGGAAGSEPGAVVLTAPEEPIPGAPGPPLPTVVIDPAHGGSDTGARARDGVLEKDLTLQWAARVRLALLATRKYHVQLTRTGDVALSFEQREILANAARPVAFLALHAGNLGNTNPRVALFIYRGTAGDSTEAPPSLIPWNLVYRAHLDQSRKLGQALQARFAQIPGIGADKAAEVPVRCLRSIDGPSVAIEIGSLNADQDSGALTSPVFQQQLATAIAAGLEAFQGGNP
jgi:N-acetylmuramoyl-L-alanine amidase